MKTQMLTLMFLLAMACCPAQTLNLRIGPTISSFERKTSTGSSNPYDKNLVGFDIMVGYDYLDFRYFNLSSNLGYIQKGGAASVLWLNSPGPEEVMLKDAKTKLNFITVNTLFEGKIPVMKFMDPFVHAGPRLDYLVSYSESVSYLSLYEGIGQLHKYIYGLVVGGGVDFKIKRLKMGIVFDYCWNFNNLVDHTASSGTRVRVSDNTFSLDFQVGYKF